MSCNLLLHEPSTEGRVPTTPTISSIIGGIEVQEAVKLLHGMPTLASKGYIFEGLHHTSYVVDYTENPECLSHYVLDKIVDLAAGIERLDTGAAVAFSAQDLNSDEVALEFSRDIIHRLVCPKCAVQQKSVLFL